MGSAYRMVLRLPEANGHFTLVPGPVAPLCGNSSQSGILWSHFALTLHNARSASTLTTRMKSGSCATVAARLSCRNKLLLYFGFAPRLRHVCLRSGSRGTSMSQRITCREIIDDNDWQLEPSLFRHFNAKWGPLTVDRFASHLSAQLPRFNSKWWSPGCEAVDCFTQAWEGEVNWCLPPPALLGDLCAFLADVPCHAVVAFPFWPSAPWWPVWMPENGPCHLATDSEIVVLCRLVLSSMCPNQNACLVQTRRLFQFVFMQVCLMTSCRAHNP